MNIHKMSEHWFDIACKELTPSQARWAEKISDEAGTTDADWAIFKAAVYLLDELEQKLLDMEYDLHHQS